jgi:prevent-host-death family protein
VKLINIQAAKTRHSRIVDQADGGEEIVLAKAGKPLVKLVPYRGSRQPRVSGQLPGVGW